MCAVRYFCVHVPLPLTSPTLSQVTVLVGEVDVSLKKSSETVKETSQTADKILKDVVSATKSMTTSSGECLNTFEAFIVKEGKITQDSLGVHFKELDEHLLSQRGGLTAMGTTSNQVTAAHHHYCVEGDLYFRPLQLRLELSS